MKENPYKSPKQESANLDPSPVGWIVCLVGWTVAVISPVLIYVIESSHGAIFEPADANTRQMYGMASTGMLSLLMICGIAAGVVGGIWWADSRRR